MAGKKQYMSDTPIVITPTVKTVRIVNRLNQGLPLNLRNGRKVEHVMLPAKPGELNVSEGSLTAAVVALENAGYVKLIRE